MNIEDKQRLEKLKKENKIKVAKKQLITDLNERYGVDLSTKVFLDYNLSEYIYKKVYEKIRSEDVKIEKFYYDKEIVSGKLEWIFGKLKSFEDKSVIFYPSTFRFNFHGFNQLYLNYPISSILTIKECKYIIFSLIHEPHDDVIVVDRELDFGFVISEDEYEYVYIEYWGI